MTTGRNGLRVVITGATGNVGTSLIPSLSRDASISSIVGVARRRPELQVEKVEWRAADVGRDELTTIFEGSDVVVHLAWLIQPSRDQSTIRRTNVDGSKRVFQAAIEAGVKAIVYASSVGGYSPGPKSLRVDESWPYGGIESSFYSSQKAEVESILDGVEEAHPEVRVVRLRPALIFKREAASGIRRLFIGPLLPGALVRPELVPLFPHVPGLEFQAVHTHDVAEAYRLAVVGDVAGTFNVAAEPALSIDTVAELLRARHFTVGPPILRRLVDLSWRLHLQPTPPGWLDMGLGVPLMDSSRARTELGWEPRFTAVEAIGELLDGLREGADLPTPPLASSTSGPLRAREFLTGIGRRT